MPSQQQIYTETLICHYDLTKHIQSIIKESGIFPSGIRPWWRGHACHDWKLTPLVYRKDEGDPTYEASIAKEFMLEAPVRYPDCPAKGDVVEWLQLMQHYGLPTRLLDWTHSPLTALFFAVLDPYDHASDGILWALNPRKFNRTQLPPPEAIFPDYPNVVEMAERALLFTEHKYPQEGFQAVAFFPKLIDTRMLLQQSVFTMHANRKYLEEQKGAENFLAKLEIPYSMKETLRFMLEDLGFSEKTLFPDLDHLSSDLIRLSRSK